MKQTVLDAVRAEKTRSGDRRKDLAPFMYDLLDEAITQRELLRDWAPLQLISVEGDSILLKDRNKNSYVTLTVRDGILQCDKHGAKPCFHIGFVWAIPSVYRMMKDHGIKKPSI